MTRLCLHWQVTLSHPILMQSSLTLITNVWTFNSGSSLALVLLTHMPKCNLKFQCGSVCIGMLTWKGSYFAFIQTERNSSLIYFTFLILFILTCDTPGNSCICDYKYKVSVPFKTKRCWHYTVDLSFSARSNMLSERTQPVPENFMFSFSFLRDEKTW